METFATAGSSNTFIPSLSDDGKKWRYIRDVSIFDAHHGSAEGLDDIDFDEDMLQKIVDRNNQRVEAGDMVPVTDGHTGEDKETPILGWARNFKLGSMKDGRKAIFCDMQFDDDNYGKVKKMAAGMEVPRRSVELWHSDLVIDPIALRPPIDSIALLQGTRPARDLGLGNNKKFNKKLYTYELRDISTEVKPVSPEDVKQCVEALQSLPEWQKLTEMCRSQYDEKEDDQDLGEGAIGVKKMEKDDDKKEDEGVDEPKLRMQFDQAKRHFAKKEAEWTSKLEAIETENKSLFQKVSDLERRERVAVRKNELLQLEAEGFSFDLPEELELVSDMEPTRFEKHVSLIKKNYKKAPVGVNIKPVAEVETPVSDPREVTRLAVLKAQEKYARSK